MRTDKRKRKNSQNSGPIMLPHTEGGTSHYNESSKLHGLDEKIIGKQNS